MKGGLFISFFEKLDPLPHLLKSHRCIPLGQVSAKGCHKIILRRLEPHLQDYACDTQCGGIAGRGADFATHVVQSFLEDNRATVQSLQGGNKDIATPQHAFMQIRVGLPPNGPSICS